TLATVDTFLRSTLTPLLNSSQFKQDGMLIIVFDRSSTSTTNGGGKTAWVTVSPKAIAGHTSSNPSVVFQHQSTLRLALNALGIDTLGVGLPGKAASAPSMMEFFNP